MIWAIGDIHGCLVELQELNKIILPTLKDDDQLVFLGDYIDRGPDSAGVIRTLIELKKLYPNTVFLRGNHEDMFLSYLGLGGRYGSSFIMNGGSHTLDSFGLEGSTHKEQVEYFKSDKDLLDFFLGLEIYKGIGNHFFVHAGINPDCGLEQQRNEDFIWIREPFLGNQHEFGKTVVHGHTPCKTMYFNLPYEINLDSACVFGNKLTALRIDESSDDPYSIIEIVAKKKYY